MPRSTHRSAAVLLVVLAMLTLFAVVGLAFVYYANDQAAAARHYREAENPRRPDVDPEMLLAHFLGQLIFDAPDDERGVYSALRGHSLARSLYGLNYALAEGPDQIARRNGVPFNGIGRLHTASASYQNPYRLDDYALVNYTYYPADDFLRDPERLGRKNDHADPLRRTRGAFVGGFNVPYTYPDLNNLYLAAAKADGTLLVPSFHRPWTDFGPLRRDNPNWGKHDDLRPHAKYFLLRPRPIDQKRNPSDPNEPERFPYPEDEDGDVKNLIGAPGGNDSVWLDLGFPILTAADGRKFKPLFAPLVLDLDNRINLNTPAFAQLLDAVRPPQSRFSAANLEGLLRHGDTGSAALSAELTQRHPKYFADPSRRRLVTTHSFDRDRPGVTPWIWNPAAAPYTLKLDQLHATGDQIGFPDLRAGMVSPPADSEFAPDYRARSAALGRLNVNRALPAYPKPDMASGRIDDQVGFEKAQLARERLAADIFGRLRVVTGAADPTKFDPQSPEFNAVRWLAQLAVNVVDYVDSDDIMTPFLWHRSADGTRHWVFGTELPRLVVNEAYVQFSGGEPWLFEVWLELHNPLRRNDALTDGGAARLVLDGKHGIYQVVLTDISENLRWPWNVRGEPDSGAILGWTDFTDTSGPDRVLPADGRTSGPEGASDGFYVIGPRAFPGDQPALSRVVPGLRKLSYERDSVISPTILLRRLACPHLPPNLDEADRLYNPYVTVDYLEELPPCDGTAPAKGVAWGRKQPYAAHSSQHTRQSPSDNGDSPRHTFFRANEPRQPAPDWLVHLDRPLISPMELLHLSGFKPHELTQQFMTTEGNFRHLARWSDPRTRIYRVFEFLTTRPDGTSDRVPGRINLNTVWDEETLLALCAAASAGGADPTAVRRMFQELIGQRHGLGGTRPGPGDRPLRGLAAGLYPQSDAQFPGSDLADTLLLSPTGQPLFWDPTAPHPYQESEMLIKVFNHVTTRSNVFAVWLTVGFFEVTDPTARPPKLGAEIGRAEGRHVRHRMFAVVDRSVLPSNPGPQPRVHPRDAGALVPYYSIID